MTSHLPQLLLPQIDRRFLKVGSWEMGVGSWECEFGIRKIDLLRSSTALNYKFGLIAQVLFRELLDRLVRFNELLLLAPNLFEGGVRTKLGVIKWASLSRTHVKIHSPRRRTLHHKSRLPVSRLFLSRTDVIHYSPI